MVGWLIRSFTTKLLSLCFQLGALTLGEEVIEPVGQVEDGEDQREDEPGTQGQAKEAGSVSVFGPAG